ncbi:ankyrin repeat-containing domain protein [Lophiotrema nucula]|uniref:Ankyrin repeat-containing domain protein n=1 Tax=Lophiotrema nucula TaxID=690887 RepID=A0A6A5YJU8_9PLEO|nr:ankyrin repeat-containing domain protein [Lophiotrema nucula]
MSLLELPAELFSQIVHQLVVDVGICQVFAYRRISRKFASEIYHNVISLQPREAFELDCQLGNRPKLLVLFDEQGAEILCRRFNAPHGFNELAFRFIRDVVEALLSHKPEPININERRESYSRAICKAWANAMGQNYLHLFSILVYPDGWANKVLRAARTKDMLPSGAAAVGDVTLLQRVLDPKTLSAGNRFLFGTPLEAATAAGQCEIIELILNTTQVPQENLHNAIHESLLIAIIRDQLEAQKVLLDYVQKRGSEFVARKQEALNRFIKTPIWMGNHKLLYAILELYCDGAFMACPDLREYLFGRGHLSIVKSLIAGGHVDPSEHIRGVSPLMFTLIKERLQTFKVLLETGADIDGIAIPELNVTCLWYSVHIGEKEDVKFLLEQGADPDSASGTWRSPIEEALQNDEQDILSILATFQAKKDSQRRILIQRGTLGLWEWSEENQDEVGIASEGPQ